jgi:hypothetical protein
LMRRYCCIIGVCSEVFSLTFTALSDMLIDDNHIVILFYLFHAGSWYHVKYRSVHELSVTIVLL